MILRFKHLLVHLLFVLVRWGEIVRTGGGQRTLCGRPFLLPCVLRFKFGSEEKGACTCSVELSLHAPAMLLKSMFLLGLVSVLVSLQGRTQSLEARTKLYSNMVLILDKISE